MAELAEPRGNTIPLTITFQAEGAFVLTTFPAGKIPVGSRINSINGIPIEEIEEKLFGYFPADGLTNMGIRRSRAGTMLPIIFPKLVGEFDDYLVSYQAPAENKHTKMSLPAFDQKTVWDAIMAAENQDPFTVEYSEQTSTATIKIKTFHFGGENENCTRFLAEAFSKIKQDNYQNLILDLRSNTGGDPVLAARLFSYLAHKPEVYFAECEGYDQLREPIELAEDHFGGNIYTIIDGGGFSTTGHIVALIKYHQIGTIIGSELGCTFTCNDSAVNVVLKNTGNVARIARATYVVAVEDMRADRGVLPDLPVAFSVTDLVDGIDTEIEFTMDLIQQSVTQGMK